MVSMSREWADLRLGRMVGTVALGLCLLLMAARLYHAVSFDHPLIIATSGSEWESLYIIWRVVHHLPAFIDRLDLPYAAATYNWLFYYAYGAVCRAVLGVFGLGDDWLPQVARFTSLALAGVAGLGAATLFRRCVPAGLRWLSWQMAALVAFGPLIGFWAFTTRADIGALACEVMAVAAFLHVLPRRPVPAALLLGVLGYCAFAFKQPNLSALVAGGTLLLLRRAWLPLAVAMVTAAGLAAATFLLGGHQYLIDVMMVGFTVVRDWARGAWQFVLFSQKMGPMVFALPVAATIVLRSIGWRRVLADDLAVVGLAGSASALLIALATIFHSGSADNYLFPASFYLSLLALRLTGLTAEAPPRLLVRAWALGWAAAATVAATVLTGVYGVTSLAFEHEGNTKAVACLRDLPGPILVTPLAGYGMLNLPWMFPGKAGWVLSFQYDAERRAGVPFAEDGISGLAERGIFGTMVTLPGGSLPDLVDQRLPGFYKLHETPECRGLTVWVREG